MDESPRLFPSLSQRAVGALNEYIQNQTHSGRILSEVELGKYESSLAAKGWRIIVEVKQQNIELDIIIDREYPFSLPRLFLVGTKRFLEWPHVEKSEKLCVIPDHSIFKISNDAGLVAHLIEEAKSLIKDCLEGANRTDFATEFLSYWNPGLSVKTPTSWSVMRPSGPTREIVFWEKQRLFFFEDSGKGKQWLCHFFGEIADLDLQFRSAYLLWLGGPLYPENYPSTNSDLRKLAQESGDTSLGILKKIIKSNPDGFPIAFGFNTEEGPVFASLWSFPPIHSIPNRKSTNPVMKGFRPGRASKIPAEILASRYLAPEGALDRRRVQRCDSTWIHTRGGDDSQAKFINKSVILIGSGALGSQIGELLAQGGIGRLTLIDDDYLTWDNVGRHNLGGKDFIGKNKADGLRNSLLGKFPHLSITAKRMKWQKAYEEDPQLFADCNLVVSTIGNWPAEAALNLLARRSVKFPPVVFGWVEPFACAGHAVYVFDIGGCFACGMDELGLFQFSPINWKTPPKTQREPGCGGFYQQFGSIAMNPVKGLIASVVIDALLGKLVRSHHRVWVSHMEAIIEKGGRWDENWLAKYGDIGNGERVLRFDWPINPACPLCNG